MPAGTLTRQEASSDSPGARDNVRRRSLGSQLVSDAYVVAFNGQRRELEEVGYLGLQAVPQLHGLL